MAEGIVWDQQAKNDFEAILSKIPNLLRSTAEKKVSQWVEKKVRSENRLAILPKDVVDGFFAVTPFGFHGPMKIDMETLGIDYKNYGY